MVHPSWRHEDKVNYNGPKVEFAAPCAGNSAVRIRLYAGKSGVSGSTHRKEKRVGDNLTSAENQQERLVQIGWVVGFVDGEGCFSISFIRQPHRERRRGYKTGYQVAHEFAVTQGEKSLACLNELRDFFGVGSVLVNKRYDNHKEHLYRYVVRKREDLIKVIIPFFRRYPMHSTKQSDFEKFTRCVE